MSEFGKPIRLAICALDDENNVIAKTEPLCAEWNVELETTMRDFGVDATAEVIKLLVEELRRSINANDIEDLIQQIKG